MPPTKSQLLETKFNVSSSDKQEKGALTNYAPSYLKYWFEKNYLYLFPTCREKLDVSLETNVSIKRIGNWFIVARKRLYPKMLKNRPELRVLYIYKNKKDNKNPIPLKDISQYFSNDAKKYLNSCVERNQNDLFSTRKQENDLILKICIPWKYTCEWLINIRKEIVFNVKKNDRFQPRARKFDRLQALTSRNCSENADECPVSNGNDSILDYDENVILNRVLGNDLTNNKFLLCPELIFDEKLFLEHLDIEDL